MELCIIMDLIYLLQDTFVDSVGIQVFEYNRGSTALSNDIYVHKTSSQKVDDKF